MQYRKMKDHLVKRHLARGGRESRRGEGENASRKGQQVSKGEPLHSPKRILDGRGGRGDGPNEWEKTINIPEG